MWHSVTQKTMSIAFKTGLSQNYAVTEYFQKFQKT